MLRDERLTVCRGIYRSGSGQAFSYGNSGSELVALVADGYFDRGLPLYPGPSQLRRVPSQPGEPNLGYAWPASTDRHGLERLTQDVLEGSKTGSDDLGHAYLVDPSLTTTFTVAGTATHVLRLRHAGGGYIDSWTRDGVELLNRHDTFRRGMQVGSTWTDTTVGELVRHNAVQGGDIHGSVGILRGGVLLSIEESYPIEGGTRLIIEFIPAEADPGGVLSIPLVRTGHGGGVNRPVLWTGLRGTLDVWVNWYGIEDLHRIESSLFRPDEPNLPHFDAELYLASFFDADRFTHLRAYDIGSGVSTTISTGVTGVAGYQDDWRRYVANPDDLRGDDEAASSAMPFTGRSVGLAATGAADGDLAVMFAQRFPAENVAGLVRSTEEHGRGNGWSWLQARAATGGPTGADTIMLAPGMFLGNRLHPQAAMRRFARVSRVETYFLTGPWSTIKPLAAEIPA